MAENILETLQELVQDVIAPGVRELQVKFDASEKQREVEYKSVQDQLASMARQIEAQSGKAEAQYKAILSAIGEASARSEVESIRSYAALSERIAVLEAARR